MGIDATQPPTDDQTKRDEFEVVAPMGEGMAQLEGSLHE